jgi:hypothetical protein
MYRPPANFTDGEALAVIGQLHISVLPASLIQHLDSFVGGMKIVQVIGNFLALQDCG